MGLNKYKFGELIELTNQENIDNKYGQIDAIGVNMDKVIKPMRGDIAEKDFGKFHIVPPGHFAYNPRGGRKLAVGFNNTDKTYIITFNDNVFRTKESAKNLLLDDWLYMYLCRKEWDRFAEFISWGSSTVVFDWNEFCDIDIDLPPIEIQQKYVDIYNAMVANQQAYETGLEDLKLVCDGYLDKIKKTATRMSMGNIFEVVDVRNTDAAITSVSGINIAKSFMPSVANVDNGSLQNYKIVKTNQFAFSGMQTGRDKCIRIALNQQKNDMIISPAYTVFRIKNSSVLEEYVMLWFSRSEIDRLGWFVSDSSIRSNLDLDRFFEMKIPIPDIKVQESIANIYKIYKERQAINEHLKTQIKDICPILIKGSLEEAKEA